jgi:hypothetical protein
MRIARPAAAAALALTVAIAAGCASAPSIRTDKDPAANLGAYETFSFFEPLATDKSPYSTLLTRHLKEAARSELEKRGYAYREEAPDLKVNFFLSVANRQELRSSPGFYGYRRGIYRSWGGYPSDLETVDYRQGTLGIDLVDSGTNALVWQGVAEGRVDRKAQKNPAETIQSVVGEILSRLPAQPAT